MERHRIATSAQQINDPGGGEAQSASKGAAERALEALLGAEGEDMVARAESLGAMLKELEKKGAPDGGAADAAPGEGAKRP